MTIRLVALMSAVLLLSLAAFGLLANHFQKQLMQEVQHTASDVGQAALRTLEWSGEVTGGWVATGPHLRVVARFDGGDDDESTVDRREAIIGHLRDRGAAHAEFDIVRHVITTSTEDRELTVREQLIYPAHAFPDALPGEALEKEFEKCLQGRVNAFSSEDKQIFINVEQVRAETDPAVGLVLTIPKLTRIGSEQTGANGATRYELLKPDGDQADVFFARHDEIRLPIRGNYGELFKTLRNRSLLLFLGVFLIGTVLSTGLASRFTRPIRKLDAGIRKLSEGNLDVAVDVTQKGEIGRLSRAFNEMAGKLRANRDRERELLRREKLSALGRLAAGVAHDVRNPLHSIGLTLQHLSDTARPEAGERGEEFDRSLGVIRGEIGRLDQLVSNFLRFAKSERLERSPTELAELVRDTVLLVRSESERRGVAIELNLEESLPPVPADGEAIRSALLNLILNSFEAMPRGGSLTIDLHADGEEIVLSVADTGEGIPEEDHEHVFDFAYTTRDGGHGLGLAMVHHCVVEEHGGRVSLESSQGEGTRVSMTLPIRAPEVS